MAGGGGAGTGQVGVGLRTGNVFALGATGTGLPAQVWRVPVRLCRARPWVVPRQGGAQGRQAVALQRGDVVFVPKSGVGNRIEGVDLYLNQLIPFVKSIGIGANYDLRRN